MGGEHSSNILFKAEYQPYDALRQRFWRQYLKLYDSHIELSSMVHSLGSTLTRTTVSSFFMRYGKDHHHDEFTIDKGVACLEEVLESPDSEKKHLYAEHSLPDTSVSGTHMLITAGARRRELCFNVAGLDFSGVPHVIAMSADGPWATPPVYAAAPSQIPQVNAAAAPVGGTQSELTQSQLGRRGRGRRVAALLLPSTGPVPIGGPASTRKNQRRMRFKRLRRASKTYSGGESWVPLTPSACAEGINTYQPAV